MGTAGPEAVELAAACGLHLDEWQRTVLADGLAERAGGKWAARNVVLIVPRQNGKGAILEAKALHSLFLSDTRLMLWTAQDFKTCSEGFLRLKTLIDGSDDLRRRVSKVRTSHGDEAIELLDGRRLRFIARSRSSGRGFSPDEIVFDEAYALTPAALSALVPATAAKPNAQIWYTSSAPLEESETLRDLCLRGRAGRTRSTCYLEWCAPSDADSEDPEACAAANPGLGIRIDEDFVASERAVLSDADFRRERLGVWAETDVSAVIPAEAWAACRDDASSASDRLVFAVDTTPSRSASSIGLAAAAASGGWHVEVIENRAGVAWVVPRLVELVARWSPAAVAIDDKGAAGSLIDACRTAGIDPTIPTSRDVAAASGRFYDACIEGAARHIGQPALDAAVAGASTRPLGDAWTWDRRRPNVDITPLVAVTLALWALGETEGSDYDLLESVG